MGLCPFGRKPKANQASPLGADQEPTWAEATEGISISLQRPLQVAFGDHRDPCAVKLHARESFAHILAAEPSASWS